MADSRRITDYRRMNRRDFARTFEYEKMPFDKQRRLESCKKIFKLCQDDLDETFSRIGTIDEAWIRQYDREPKKKSMQWIEKRKGPPKNFQLEKSAS